MKHHYLIRLDDACPTMARAKWRRMEDILDRYGVIPMVGIIPKNEDPQQLIDPEDIAFWNKVHAWEKKGWTIALHGYDHCYISRDGLKGLNPMWERSEFAGLPLEKQKEKIRNGVAIMRKHGINPRFFFSPSHTFDENTLVALREESDIRIISDTVSLMPYCRDDFVFIPQFGGQCREMMIGGIFTFCLHPSTMEDVSFKQIERFLNNHRQEFTTFDALDLAHLGQKRVIDKALSWLYFKRRG